MHKCTILILECITSLSQLLVAFFTVEFSFSEGNLPSSGIAQHPYVHLHARGRRKNDKLFQPGPPDPNCLSSPQRVVGCVTGPHDPRPHLVRSNDGVSLLAPSFPFGAGSVAGSPTLALPLHPETLGALSISNCSPPPLHPVPHPVV